MFGGKDDRDVKGLGDVEDGFAVVLFEEADDLSSKDLIVVISKLQHQHP